MALGLILIPVGVIIAIFNGPLARWNEWMPGAIARGPAAIAVGRVFWVVAGAFSMVVGAAAIAH